MGNTMNWKEIVVLPTVVVGIGLLWIVWEAKQTKAEQETAFHVPTSNDRQEYVDFMRELSAYSMNFQETWHYERAYDSLLEASARVRELTPPGEEIPRFAALCDVGYRAYRFVSIERPDKDETKQLLDDFESYLSRKDAFPERKRDQEMLSSTLTICLLLLERQGVSKDEMLARANSFQAWFDTCEITMIQTSAERALDGFRNRIRLLGERYRLVGRTLDGADLDTEAFLGKVILLEFWTTTCGPCISELPILKSIHEKHADELEIVGLSGDRSRRMLAQFVEDRSIPWLQLWADPEFGNDDLIESLGIHQYPSSILLDRNGVVVAFNVRAEADGSGKSLEEWLDEL